MGSSSDLPAYLLGYGHADSPSGSPRASTTTTAMSSAHSSVHSARTNSYAARRNISLSGIDHVAATSGNGGVKRKPVGRTASRARPTPAVVTDQDAYTYALRAAFLAYLLQPRQRRVQHVANTSKPIQRSSTSINDMVKDFALIRDSKSTRFPHGFMAALDKRITGVLIGSEKGPEYADALVKRTFANFLNEFKNPTFRKTMEKDRRVEDLLLIFYSRATSELQKGKDGGDDSWKWMVDRHVALFVRLISGTLHTNDWTRDRPELSSRLKTLETKLLQHDQDLTSDTSGRGGAGQGGQNIEVEVPRSFEVRDMPLVIRVCSIFAKPTIQAQNDIDANKETWTEKAALKDLKDYQNHMMLNTRVTLSRDDFEGDEAFENWRKGEFSDLSQMMLAIVQSNPELAKMSSGGAGGSLPTFKPELKHTDSSYSTATTGDASRNSSASAGAETGAESYVIDQPIDISSLSLMSGESPRDSGTASIDTSQNPSFTFIPPDARAYYRQLLKIALTHDLTDSDLEPPATDDGSGIKLLSKQSTELLNEVALRWRIPMFSRMVLFLDVAREKYLEREVSLDTLDAAFLYTKEPPPQETQGAKKKLAGSSSQQQQQHIQQTLFDRSRWTITDRRLMSGALGTLHDALLRELFELFQHCFEAKPPSIGEVMYVLDTHIDADDLFSVSPEDADAFTATLGEALTEKARGKYHELLSKHVSEEAAKWEFYNVIQLGKAVIGLGEKIQKRYRKNPVVMGVNPHTVFIEEVLPAYAEDGKELIQRIVSLAQEKGEEVPVQDGFELYGELCEMRKTWARWFGGERAFGFDIEALLASFVWRWIAITEGKLIAWVEGAVAQDDFLVREGETAGEDQRHSQSAVDIYRIFNQSVEQIVALEWDDDLMYARFMTTLAKAIGKGIARYCELLETKFAKEMDRATPEQEARAQQTQREKWISAARDAWANGGRGVGMGGEKIEPFQFWPESFVKMNNIEYATLQLDHLEREINVDACAEVIQRLDPPLPPHIARRQQGPGGASSKFTFTIKILEAEDLKAGDANGLSDPYVVLGDEYQKRLAKTRIVYGSLNPRWDETVDILTAGPLNIIATVWDWDMLGDHDCLGRTSLKLDPGHFNDFLPREYWLDLDTQGRVLVRVSMEGEGDDIDFYFAKAFRTLRRCERDMARRVTEKLSAYIQSCLSRRTLKVLCGSQGAGAGAALLAGGGSAMNSARGYFSKISSQVSGRSMGGAAGSLPMASPGTSTSATTPGGGPTTPGAAPQDVTQALKPLLTYFNDNFAIMQRTLTPPAMLTVLTRLWKETLATLEALLVPPLSDKLSSQRPVTQPELDVVYRWLAVLFDFFLAYDDEDQKAHGVPQEILKSQKYQDLVMVNFFYFESTEDLIRTSDGIAQAAARRQQQPQQDTSTPNNQNRLSAPSFPSPRLSTRNRNRSTTSPNPTSPNPTNLPNRNLGTQRQLRFAAKRTQQAQQAPPSDDVILRILRMRPEAERYLRDRRRQRERLAAAAAAERIVRESLGGTGGARGGGTGGGGGGRGVGRWDTIRE
ncbi:hypothetical protein B0A50_00804 [Salinomyces thailandicus]|uniref:C2 domain-containing protein n=1 Tax=Salinomyces thailandicus TaxID=706561 RepID=A0A4U0UCL8_9PEZI|nr:hypothetical protein B0A50_00804 [Salinomyces thailandica]